MLDGWSEAALLNCPRAFMRTKHMLNDRTLINVQYEFRDALEKNEPKTP